MANGPTTIGPRAASVNTILSYSFAADTRAIYVQNYSRYTLLVSFADAEPTATDSLNNQYDGVLSPGGRDVFYVQSRGASSQERGINRIGAFTGKVWIMPVDRTGSQANAGTVSGVNDVWVSAYGPYDPEPPITGGMPLNVDLSSQPRVISLPPPGAQLLGDSSQDWTTSAPGAHLLIPLAATANNLAAGQMIVYIFHLGLFPQVVTSGTFIQTRIALQAQPSDASNTPLGSPTTLYHVPVISGLSTSAVYAPPIILQPYFPLAAIVPLPGNTANVWLQFVKVGGGDMVIEYQYAIWYDQNNAGSPPGYGGSIQAQRWNGQFSTSAGIW